MTPYERGFLDGQIAMRERAAKVCGKLAEEASNKYKREYATRGSSYWEGACDTSDACEREILSLQPEGADQRGAAAPNLRTGYTSGQSCVEPPQTQSAPHPNLPDYPQMIASRLQGIYGELMQAATNPDEQVASQATVITAGCNADQRTLNEPAPARPGPSQECVSVPFSIAYHLESMSLEMGGKCHICSQFRSLLAAAKEEHDAHR